MTQIEANNKNNIDCSPLNSLYCTLKVNLTGKLNNKDLNKLYKCTLCNQCKTAQFNKNTRKKAVCRGHIMPHLENISENINEYGNSYGINPAINIDKHQKMETILFRGCTSKYKAPQILKSIQGLLEHEGIDYNIMESETCCGNILFNLGDHESGYTAVRKNIAKFKKSGVKKIITICPGCYSALNKYYKGNNGFDVEIHLAIDLLNGSTMLKDDFVIQDPCHAREKADKVRNIIKGSKNKNASQCCGAGAGVMAHDKQLAVTKARKTMDNSEKIVTYCPFCYINLSSLDPSKAIDIYMLLDGQNKIEG